jgi:drug/metabolite transporter (DMT)-like permease
MKERSTSRYTGDLLMFATVMLMGSSYPFAKDVLAIMSPLLYSASRYLVAVLFLFAMMAVLRKPLALPRRDWVPMIVPSLMGVALFQACWGLAMARTAPSVGSIVMTTTTAFSAILAWLGGRRLPATGWAGIVIAFLGVIIVVNNSLSRITLSFDSLDGTLIWMLSAFAWALYVDRSAPYNVRLGALPVMAWTTLIGSLILLPVSLIFDSLGEFVRLDDRGRGLPRPDGRAGPPGSEPGHGLHVPDPGGRRGPVGGVFRRSADGGPRAGRPDRAFGRHSDARCARPRGAGSCMNGLPT